MSGNIDAIALYSELCDLVAEAGAVDTVIGRPETLVRRLTTLRDLVGATKRDIPAGTSQASRDVLEERQRQINGEGWSPVHDDAHDDGSLGAAAAAYALAAADILHPQSQGDGGYESTNPPPLWPEGWAFKASDPRRMLVKAAALAIAEIERLDRAHGPRPLDLDAGSRTFVRAHIEAERVQWTGSPKGAVWPTMGNYSFEVKWTFVVPPANSTRVEIMQRQDGPFRGDVVGGRGHYYVSLQQLDRGASLWRHVAGSTHAVGLPNFGRAFEVAQAMWERERKDPRDAGKGGA